jgi:aspartate kinase
MQVFKFGGASVSSIDRIKQVASILSSYKGKPLVVVISAMGKTTNELETVVEAFYQGNKDTALSLFNTIKQRHLATFQALMPRGDGEAALLDLFTEVEWLLHDRAVREYDYYYDQIVCIGELLSTTIVHHFLVSEGIANTWIDVRDVLRTDANFRDANVDIAFAGWQAQIQIQPLMNQGKIVLLQGFIGSTSENESTTLGREGSDYTAAIFSNLLKAESLTIWKDVEGVMNADPKLFPDAQLIRELNYTEVIEMAFYGAQVIHPKRADSYVCQVLFGSILTRHAHPFYPPLIPSSHHHPEERPDSAEIGFKRLLLRGRDFRGEAV